MILLQGLVQLFRPANRAPISSSFIGFLEGSHILGSIQSIPENAGNDKLGQLRGGQTPLGAKTPVSFLGLAILLGGGNAFDLGADQRTNRVSGQKSGKDRNQGHS